MKKTNTTISNFGKRDITAVAFFLSIFVYKLIIGTQGLNIYDEGFQLVGFQNILTHPESVQYQFLYYLGFLCGGIWNHFFGEFSIYGLRFLSSIVSVLTFFFLYKALKGVIRTRYIYLGIILLSLFNQLSTTFNHNTLTTFFNVAAAYLLYLSIYKNKIKYILFSGFIIGVNVYVRIPNLAMTGLILALVPFYLYNKNLKLTGKYFMFAILGFILGNTAVLILLYSLHHLPYMTEAILGQLSGDNDSSHNLAYIFKTYIVADYIPLLKNILLLSIVPLFIYYVPHFIRSSKMIHVLLCMSVLFFCFIIFKYYYSIPFLNSFSTAILLLSLFYYRTNKKIVYLSALGLLIEYLHPMGGDWGFFNITPLNIYLSLPLSIGLAEKLISKIHSNNISRMYLNSVMGVFCSFLFLKGLKATVLHEKWYGTYPVWTMTYRPHLENVNILLDENRGKELEELTKSLNQYVTKGDFLFSIDECPIAYYLTYTQPYLYNPLVWCYGTGQLNMRLIQAERERKEVPVALLEKNTGAYYSFINNRYDLPESYRNNNRKNKIYNAYLKRHNYQIAWENEKYVILLPHSSFTDKKAEI